MSVAQIQYNTERNKLIIPEYGRHLQKMIDHVVAIEDKEERNQQAKAIIAVMGNLQPHLRDVPDFQHKLWDQLFIISKFELDVDSPYPILTKEKLEERPDPLGYPQNFPKYRFYGNNIKRMIDVAISWEDNELKEALVLTIANHMKKCFLNWNKDTVEDPVIFKHLFELSNGELDIRNSGEELSGAADLMRSNKKKQTSNSNTGSKGKKNYRKTNNKRY